MNNNQRSALKRSNNKKKTPDGISADDMGMLSSLLLEAFTAPYGLKLNLENMTLVSLNKPFSGYVITTWGSCQPTVAQTILQAC